jgi:hypothetical protein
MTLINIVLEEAQADGGIEAMREVWFRAVAFSNSFDFGMLPPDLASLP